MKLMIQKTSNKFLWILLWCVMICSFTVDAQQENTSNTEPTLEVLQSHLKKLQCFDSINNVDSLKQYLETGKALVRNVDFSNPNTKEFHRTTADLYGFLASKEYAFDNLPIALITYQKAADIYKSLNIEYESGRCLNNIGIIHLKIGNQTTALNYFYQSTIIFESIKDSIGIVLGYNNMARIHRQQKDYQKAQEYLDKALVVVRAIDDLGMMTSVLNSMAGLKKDLGDQSSALNLYEKALSASNLADNKVKTAMILNNLGVINKDLRNLKEAKIYFDRAYKITDDNDFIYEKAFTLVNLAKYYFIKKNYKETEKLATESLLLTDKVINNEAKLRAINVLITLYEAQEKWEKVAIYQQQLLDEKERHEKQTHEQIAQQEALRFKLESEKNAARNQEINGQLTKQIELQNLRLYYILFIVAFVIVLAFALIVFIRLRTSRRRNRNIIKQSEERKLLLQEVHHRVKNNFQLVSSMLRLQSYNFDSEELRQNFEEAVNRINAMAIVHDVIYRQEKFSDIDAKTYLEKLVENLHKTGDSRILIEIESEEIPFKIETLINLGIAINEMIANSFKHAFNEDILQPKIKISLSAIAEKTYELVYRDNGTGISEETYASNFGMELIDTIISNFDGSVELRPEKEWKTVILITFKEF